MSDYLRQLHEARQERLRRMQGSLPAPPPTVPRPLERPTWHRCIVLVTSTYERRVRKKMVPITVQEILSGSRRLSIVKARDLAIYLTRQTTKMSTPEIGRRFGGRHHATVLHSIAKVEAIMDKKPGAREEIERLLQQIKPPEAPCPLSSTTQQP